jgi:hypothetical protein
MCRCESFTPLLILILSQSALLLWFADGVNSQVGTELRLRVGLPPNPTPRCRCRCQCRKYWHQPTQLCRRYFLILNPNLFAFFIFETQKKHVLTLFLESEKLTRTPTPTFFWCWCFDTDNDIDTRYFGVSGKSSYEERLRSTTYVMSKVKASHHLRLVFPEASFSYV